mmetsp:Transcript_5556/g.20930  ORF Transcript_5556/g.20930 Transcript_5556/m.20930 type:complete len:201 (+) Transcript_5556:1121-1723(+)
MAEQQLHAKISLFKENTDRFQSFISPSMETVHKRVSTSGTLLRKATDVTLHLCGASQVVTQVNLTCLFSCAGESLEGIFSRLSQILRVSVHIYSVHEEKHCARLTRASLSSLEEAPSDLRETVTRKKPSGLKTSCVTISSSPPIMSACAVWSLDETCTSKMCESRVKSKSCTFAPAAEDASAPDDGSIARQVGVSALLKE